MSDDLSKKSLQDRIAELVKARKEDPTAGQEVSEEMLAKIVGGSGGSGGEKDFDYKDDGANVHFFERKF